MERAPEGCSPGRHPGKQAGARKLAIASSPYDYLESKGNTSVLAPLDRDSLLVALVGV